MNLIMVAGVPSRFREFKVLEMITDPDLPDSIELETEWKNIPESLKKNKFTIYDGQGLTRAERTEKYLEAKRMGANKVSILMIYASLEALEEDYESPPKELREDYMRLEPPKIGLDCDVFAVEGEQFFAVETMHTLYNSENDFANTVVSDGIIAEIDSTTDSTREDISLMVEDSHSAFLKFLSFFGNVARDFAPKNWNRIGANYVLNALYFSNGRSTSKIPSFDLVEAVLYQDDLTKFPEDSSLRRVLAHYDREVRLREEVND